MGNRSFFSARGSEFSTSGFRNRAIAELAREHVGSHALEEAQMFAWRKELECLAPVAKAFPESTIALEYMIPRMGRRVDAVVLVDRAIFIIEFKVGEKNYPADALNQLEDYIFDLENFHKKSHGRTMVPVLVCTQAKAWKNYAQEIAKRDVRVSVDRRLAAQDAESNAHDEDEHAAVLRSNGEDLLSAINFALAKGAFSEEALDHQAWLNSLYSPTPTIVEAAQALYQSNNVEEISRSEAGLTNISETTDCVDHIIMHSKRNRRKSICFITGVPGAGKTLVGLNLASKRREEHQVSGEEVAVFLSGNGPLIEVLQASLVEDQQRRNKEHCEACRLVNSSPRCRGCEFKQTKRAIEGEVKSFVQGVHLFREEYFITDEPPVEHIAIFDEAQRAWNEHQLSYKMRTRWQNKRQVEMSEPQVLIDYLDRHQDWAVIVCLVGGGQEIHTGEAGIIEWFNALEQFHPDWDVYVSKAIGAEVYLGEAASSRAASRYKYEERLHLAVDMRSFRNKNVAAFAEAVVTNKPSEARNLYECINSDYPIYITRDLLAAKEWVRGETKRPSDRYGIVADSYGQRIRADGILVPTLDFDAVKWFLRGKDEIDSSYYMEIAASEFKIQGLEIDYAIVAWEGDYRYQDGDFQHHRFVGGKWQNVHTEMGQRYLRNGYRVLLTRARQGYVIYVPAGSRYDATRKPSFYNDTYNYLRNCGIQELPLSGIDAS